MKKLMMIWGLVFGLTIGAMAEGVTVNKQLAQKRADRLTDMMVQDLQLNYYQARKLRAINVARVSEMMAYENQYAGNQTTIDGKCKEVCNQRDLELESFLSTDQYNKYFGARKKYNKFDKQFNINLASNETQVQKEKAATDVLN